MAKRKTSVSPSHIPTLIVVLALLVFTSTVSLVNEYSATAASVARVKKKTPKLSGTARELQGVWQLTKMVVVGEGEADGQSSLADEELKPAMPDYLVFAGKVMCRAKSKVASEVICFEPWANYHVRGNQIISQRYLGDLGSLRFRKGHLTAVWGGGGGKGGMVESLYERNTLRSEPAPPNENIGLPEDPQRLARLKAATEDILTQVSVWESEIAAEAARFGYTLTPDLLNKGLLSGFEGAYVEILQWNKRAQKELAEDNITGAYHFAVATEEAYRQAKRAIPNQRRAYEMNQKLEAERQAQQQSVVETEGEIRPTPHIPRALNETDQSLQGAWQLEKISVKEGATWRDLTFVEIYRGLNNYLIFAGDRFCTQGMVTVTSGELVCTNNFIPYTLEGTRVRNNIIMGDKDEMKLVGSTIEYLIQTEYDTSRSLYVKRPGMILPRS